MKYTAFLKMVTLIAACGGNSDYDHYAGPDAAHDRQGDPVHQESNRTADTTLPGVPDHPLDETAAGWFDTVLDDYLRLSTVLVGSDAPGAASAAARLKTSADQLGQADFDEPVREQAAGWIGVLQARSREIESSSDVEEQRKSYHDLSETMISMVEAFGHRKSRLYHQRCPMVNGGNGDWLSTQERIMNPYHGDRMLHCGSTVRIL